MIVHFYTIPQVDITRPLVSVMIPTRGRPDKLKRAIESLRANALDPKRFEILVRIDNDDHAARDFVLSGGVGPVTVVQGSREQGYLSIHTFIHQMAERARGYWLMAFNDDAVMVTKEWDKVFDVIIAEGGGPAKGITKHEFYVDEIWLMQPDIVGKTNSNELFAVTRKTYEVLGHLSKNMGVDVWLDVVFAAIQRKLRANILVAHGNEKDATFTQGRECVDDPLEWALTASPAVKRQRLEDALKLTDYINHVHNNKLNKLFYEMLPDGGLKIVYGERLGVMQKKDTIIAPMST